MPGTERGHAPVFIVGCPRSGTTLLYHMLLSAGGFAVYRAETQVFNTLEPSYGDLSKAGNKKRLMRAWLGSKLFRVSGLDAQEIEAKVLAECRDGGDFLRIVMGEIARKQNVARWADCTPDHLLYLRRIQETVPDALIIHIIRDGRDVALSMVKQGWIRPLPGQKGDGLMAAALYWEWALGRGRRDARDLGVEYCEVRFEDLIRAPREVLARVGAFIEQELDYDRIQQVAIGSVREPNTSFENPQDGKRFDPLDRWRQGLSQGELARIETAIGGTLSELGYRPEAPQLAQGEQSRLRRTRNLYRRYFDFKLSMKKTPVAKWFVNKNLSWL